MVTKERVEARGKGMLVRRRKGGRGKMAGALNRDLKDASEVEEVAGNVDEGGRSMERTGNRRVLIN